MHIDVSNGLDIPVKGVPSGSVQSLPLPKKVALDLSEFLGVQFRLKVQVGDSVKIGQPLAEDKKHPGRMFVSPGGGTVIEIRRGLKRRLLYIVVELASKEEYVEYGAADPEKLSRDELVAHLKECGLLAHLRMRPFDLIVRPQQIPRSIFVKAVETAPFHPSAEMQVKGFEAEFQMGLNTLRQLTSGSVHLVYKKDSDCKVFTEAQGVERHTVSGPHPASNQSVHIHNIDPINQTEDLIWTASAHDVVSIGQIMLKGRYHIERLISIGGEGVTDGMTGYFKARAGYPISQLVANRSGHGAIRFISGNLLTGKQVDEEDFLGLHHCTFAMIPENLSRELLHFFRLGLHKYSSHKVYASGHMKGSDKAFSFTTNQHGEERAFVDGAAYEKVMPMRIPTMHLMKAVIGEDWDTAEELGFLEVVGEDLALPTFVCPSKIEMQDIIHQAQLAYAAEVLN